MVDTTKTLDDLKYLLKTKGMKYTEQRAVILQILIDLETHLNAEEVHTIIKNKYPL